MFRNTMLEDTCTTKEPINSFPIIIPCLSFVAGYLYFLLMPFFIYPVTVVFMVIFGVLLTLPSYNILM